MNLAQVLNTFEIVAGGQGSGPNAPCPQCGPHSGKGDKGHVIEEKDIVKLHTPDSLYNYKTGNVDKFGPGLKAVVVNVLPKVGDNPQMVKVNILSPGKKHEQDNFRYMKLTDVSLHKLGSTEQVKDIKPVSKSKTLLKFKTSDGADVTIVKPHTEGEHDPKSLKELSMTPHYLKGNFSITESLKGLQDRPGYTRVSKIYDTSGMPNYLQKGSNATVYVNTYSQKGAIKNVVVQEQNTTTYSQKSKGVIEFSYKTSGKPGWNMGAAAAVGMLRQRYGIKSGLGKLSKAKFGV